jgi:hypothetical protein
MAEGAADAIKDEDQIQGQGWWRQQQDGRSATQNDRC